MRNDKPISGQLYQLTGAPGEACIANGNTWAQSEIPHERHTYKAGDIIRHIWGYDQTNVDFYQVTRTSASSIWIRAIDQKTTETGFMSGNTVPLRNVFKGEEMVKRPKYWKYDGTWHVTMNSYSASAKLWDGTPQRASWYA